MSGEAEPPLAKYGQSSDFGSVLDFIQSMISNDILRKSFDIPHLVMVGRQNMAKTTLINRLIGRYLLPMRRNETANTLQARTTYPIILNLRNGPKTIVEVRCDTCQGIGGEVENPTDDQVEDFLKQVAGHLPKEKGTPISKSPVNVTLQGTFNSVIRTTDHVSRCLSSLCLSLVLDELQTDPTTRKIFFSCLIFQLDKCSFVRDREKVSNTILVP